MKKKASFKSLSFKITLYVFLIFTVPSAIALSLLSWYLSSSMNAPGLSTMKVGVFGLAALLVLCFLIFAVVLYRLLSPLNELKQAMQKVDLKGSRLPYQFEASHELGEIAQSFNDMVETMRVTNRELLRRIALASSISEIAPNAHMLIDSTGIIFSVNPAADRIFGYGPENLLGENISTILPPQYQGHYDRDPKNYLNGGIMNRVGKQTETMAVRKNGQPFPVDLYIGEAAVENDTIYVAIVEDITHRKLAEADHKDLEYRKKVETELKAAIKDAEKANQAKSLFLSSMSHELRTPLNSILGYGQLLTSNKKDQLTPTQNQMANQILNAGNHLLELINEVLDLSKIEAGDTHLEMTEVEVAPVINELLAYIEPLSQKYGIEVINKITDSKEYVKADRTRFKQVLMNLLSNAIKYNRPQGKVFFSWETTPERIRFKVEDTGLGIAAENLDLVFEPFDRLGAETSNIEGTGIGLTITKRLVSLMGGEIHVASQIDKGTTFQVELSKAVLPEKGAKETAKPAVQSEIGSDDSTLTILYIEDNPSNLKLVQTILQTQKNIDFLSAIDATSGIEIAITKQPDLVLMDINLPDIDGYEALTRLHDEPKTTAIPVVALSANAMPEDIDKAKSAGFKDYITKPININTFLNVISSALAD